VETMRLRTGFIPGKALNGEKMERAKGFEPSTFTLAT
jgi:hypothetical protein